MLVTDRFEEVFFKENSIQVRGTLQPIQDQKLYDDDYFYHRQILRVRSGMPVSAGDVLKDRYNRYFLLGTLDVSHGYESFQMYQCNRQVGWKRENTELDALTNLPIGTGLQTLGTIWILDELLAREAGSTNIKAKEEVRRVLTGSAVQLGDVIDDMRVRKVNITHGIRVLELV